MNVKFPHPIKGEIDKRVRRFYGEKAGKRVPASCKNCLWFKKPLAGNSKPCEVQYQFAEKEEQKIPCPEEFLCQKHTHKEHDPAITILSEQKLSTLKVWQKMFPVISPLLEDYGKDVLTKDFLNLLKLDQLSLPTLKEWVRLYIKSAPGVEAENLPSIKSEWLIKDRKTGKTFEGVVWKTSKHRVTILPDRAYRKIYGEEYTVESELFAQIATNLLLPEEEEESTE